MPPRPRKAAAAAAGGQRGRRDPRVAAQLAAAEAEAQGLTSTGDPEIDEQQLDVDLRPHDAEGPEDDGQDFLLFDGERLTLGITYAVDVTGNGKTDFVRAAYTGIVQEGEDLDEFFTRVSGIVGSAAVSNAHEAAERWLEYQTAVNDQLQAIAGGQRQ